MMGELRQLQRHDQRRASTFIDLTRTLDALPERSSRLEVAAMRWPTRRPALRHRGAERAPWHRPRRRRQRLTVAGRVGRAGDG